MEEFKKSVKQRVWNCTELLHIRFDIFISNLVPSRHFTNGFS